MATVIALLLMAGFVWFVVALVVGSNRLAKKGLNALDGLERLSQTQRSNLPPPPPGSRVG